VKRNLLYSVLPTYIIFAVTIIALLATEKIVDAQAESQDAPKSVQKKVQKHLGDTQAKKPSAPTETTDPQGGVVEQKELPTVPKDLPTELKGLPVAHEDFPPGLKEPSAPQKELPNSVQDKIRAKLSASAPGKILAFDAEGNEVDSKSVSETKSHKYESFSDLLVSHDSPVSCEAPITPTPPPPCVICKSGQVLCSTSSFPKTNELLPANQPVLKSPEEGKPQ